MQHPEKLILVGGMSRSGTTLLSAALDAHEQITAGAELIPTNIPDLTQLRQRLVEALDETEDLREAGRNIEKSLETAQGIFISRCYRAGATAEEVLGAIDDMLAAGKSSAIEFPNRFALAANIIERRRTRGGFAFGSFKINSPAVTSALETHTNAYAICLVRNPVAVLISHLNNNFEKTPKEVCKAWLNYLNAFDRAKSGFADRTIIIRYEDLATRPKDTLETIFASLPLDMDERMLRYQECGGRILNSQHRNTAQLIKGFQTPAGDGQPEEVEPETQCIVERYCGTEMQRWGYPLKMGKPSVASRWTARLTGWRSRLRAIQ